MCACAVLGDRKVTSNAWAASSSSNARKAGKRVQVRAAATTYTADALAGSGPEKEPREVSTQAVASPDASTEAMVSGTDALAKYVAAHGGKRIIRKVLIANNGMAATKAIISMRRWAYNELGDENAIQFLAMATPEASGGGASSRPRA